MAQFKNPTEPETRSIFEKGILSRNPVLVYAIGICPLIAVAKSAATAAVLAFLSAVLLIFLEILTALIFKKMPKWLRIGVYAITGILLIIPFYMLMDIYMPSIEVSLGIYIPLLAVNSLTVQRCEAFAVKHSVKSAFLDAAANSIGYAIPLILTGIIREALGSSSIFGHYIDALPHADGFLMPFCGFIILGFVAAFINYMRSAFRIGDEFDTKDNDFVIDKPKIKEKINDNDADSLQNEIAFIPESVSEPVKPDTTVKSPAEDTEKNDSSANFESSVNRIMHKWSPLNSAEVSEEITPEAKSALDEMNNAISELHTDTENADDISADNTQAPAPKKTTRKRTAKKSAASANVNTDSASSDKSTETKELSAENAVVSDTAEAPAQKKATRKRTAKKSAASANVNTDTASSVESTKTSENNTLSTDTADNTTNKKTTRKRTKKTDSTQESAKTDLSSENLSDDETAVPLKKTTRKRATRKTESQTQETKSKLPESEQVAAPKKTTRRRTTPKSTETPSPVKESALKED